MRFWLVVVVCACSSSHAQQPIGNRVPAGAGGGAFASIAGDWSGRGYQPDTESGWIVGLTLEPRAAVGDRVGTIKYPDLGCSGFLVRLPWTNDAQLRMREQPT